MGGKPIFRFQFPVAFKQKELIIFNLLMYHADPYMLEIRLDLLLNELT